MIDHRPEPRPAAAGDSGASPASARETLERAAAGLVYSSEGDAPFAYVELAPPVAPGAGDPSPPPLAAAAIARLAGAAPGARVEERTLDSFLAHHRERVDPLDAASQALRPRYDALAAALRGALADVRVVRVSVPGTAEVRCYVVGRDARGALVGLATTAIET